VVFCANTEAPSSGSLVSASVIFPVTVLCEKAKVQDNKAQVARRSCGNFIVALK